MSPFAALIPIFSWIFLNVSTCVLLTVPFRHRLYFLPAVLIPVAISFSTIQRLEFIPGLSELWGTITLIGLIHSTSLLYIKRWTLCITSSAKDLPKRKAAWFSKTLWTQMYKVALSPRFVGIPYKNIIPEQHTGNQLKSTALHGRFSMKRVLWLLFKIALNLFFNKLIVRSFKVIDINDFAAVKTILLRRLFQSLIRGSASQVSAREIVVRLWFTANSIWTPILLLDCIHTALAILFIYVVRIDIPEDWPDVFGSPSEAYTLSRFWTRYVHTKLCSGMTADEI